MVSRRLEEVGNKHNECVVEDIGDASIGSQGGVDMGDTEDGKTE